MQHKRVVHKDYCEISLGQIPLLFGSPWVVNTSSGVTISLRARQVSDNTVEDSLSCVAV